MSCGRPEERCPAGHRREQSQAVGSSYTYTWKTSPSWGGTCRRLIVTLADGSTHEALFSFTKPAAATTSSNAKRILGR